MPSLLALRALLGAGLGLGALDLVWINAALAPRLADTTPAPAIATPTPTPAPVVTPIELPREAIIDHVYFDTGSAVITARGHEVLAHLAATTGPTAQIALAGHADCRGGEALNQTLSKDRAIAVQQELVRLGLDRARIHVDYAGATRDSSDLWRERRVDIRITGGTR
jgi:outer membrane protein OmpA-like peptidoglycan-associated protein